MDLTRLLNYDQSYDQRPYLKQTNWNMHVIQSGRVKKTPKSFICLDCPGPKSFTRRGDLERHKRIHTGDKPFICTEPECLKKNRRFIQKSGLDTHIRTHTGERPFQCRSGCKKSFSDSSCRKRHEASHESEKRYSCQYCQNEGLHKAFTRKRTLDGHIKTCHPSVLKQDCTGRRDSSINFDFTREYSALSLNTVSGSPTFTTIPTSPLTASLPPIFPHAYESHLFSPGGSRSH